MKLKELIQKLNLELTTSSTALDAEVENAYASDILSDVMSHAKEGSVWITLQTHRNTVSVAELKSFAGVILVGGRRPDDETLKKANEENIPIFSTKLSSFEIAGKLYELGIRG
ncbi:MAG TPA: DRTGG domain-containing protein [Spirochaetota bacterium]|jgi:predicted transcriptional regulator|nr:DRTGG domain-containing protein [Spirochaetota bacterium]HPV42374.1 DRTGG domain-containing protein [Spirochaetota bacterium]